MHKNYLKNGRKIVSLLAIAAATQASYAQIDVTSSFLTNPSFEEGTSDGWDQLNFDSSGDPNGARTQVRLEKEGGVGFFDGTEALEAWCPSSNADSPSKKGLGVFDVSQTVYELPAGTYQFSVGAKGLNQGTPFEAVHNLFLYANGDTIAISTPMVKGSDGTVINKVPNGGNNEPISEFFKVETTITTEGEIKFGFGSKSIEEGEIQANWICFDNFRMYLVACDDMVFMYKAQIEDMLGAYLDYSYSADIAGFYRSQLVNGGSLWTEFEELSSASASEEEFKSFYDKVSETVVAAEVTRSYMLELTELVNIANELEGLEYPGSDELYEATGIALSFYMSEDATLEDLQGAIADMNKAIFDYKLSVTVNATDANPSDITSIIINSTLEAGVTSAYSVPTGWNCSNSGGNDKFVYIPEDGSASFEAWSGNPANMNFDYYQEITGLPTGIYTLKANARSCDGDEPNGNAVIYASAENEKTASVFNPLVNGTGAVATEMSEYEVKGVFVANGTLRIGAKNIGALSSQWTIYDDFQLFFHGNEAGLENFKSALSDRIVEAESYHAMDMLPQDKSYLNGAIWDAKDALELESANEVSAAIDALKSAIDTAKEAVEVMSKFKAGNYKKVTDFDSDDDILLEIVDAVIESVDERLKEMSVSAEDLDIISSQLEELLTFFDLHTSMNKELDSEVAYSIDAINAFEDKIAQTLKSLISESALDLLDQATQDLNDALLALRNSAINAGTTTNLTAWIINAGFENGTTGWVNNGMATQSNNDFAEKSDTYFAETWVPSLSNVDDATIYQSVIVPEGMYTITVDASATQQDAEVIEGVNLVAFNGDVTNAKYTTAITSRYVVAPVVDSTYVEVKDGEGNNVIDTETGLIVMDTIVTVISPAELTYSLTIAADRGVITLGVETLNANANWVRFDNFTLTYNGAIPSSIEDVNNDADSFYVYVNGNKLVVAGVENYIVYSSNGQVVSANAELTPGLYIVKSGSKSVKVLVK